MRSALFPASLRFVSVALALGLAGVAQAASAPPLPATSVTVQDDQRAATNDHLDTRIEWNVDYPSQIGPDGPRTQSSWTAATRDDASLAPSSR